ncbi:MAG TPA: lysophospholipid acyltransferase family protein [Opitutaceae bacterium]|jgi:1-acyl-sn-glycerol-3-phosphate acyltransferase
MTEPESRERAMDPVYGFFYGMCRLAHQMLFRGDSYGLSNLPPKGGYIVAANHASLLDPPIVGQFLPRQVSFFARKTLWKPGFASWWLTAVGTIPVDRDGGASLDAVKRVLQALAQGKVVIVFPEGTRSANGELQAAKPGVGLLACKARVPVVPARVFGSFEAFGRDSRVHLGIPVSVCYGKPVLPSEYDRPGDGKERYARTAARIMDAIARIEPGEPVVI